MRRTLRCVDVCVVRAQSEYIYGGDEGRTPSLLRRQRHKHSSTRAEHLLGTQARCVHAVELCGSVEVRLWEGGVKYPKIIVRPFNPVLHTYSLSLMVHTDALMN